MQQKLADSPPHGPGTYYRKIEAELAACAAKKPTIPPKTPTTWITKYNATHRQARQKRNAQVANLARQGLTEKEIAEALALLIRSVRARLKWAYKHEQI